MSPSESNSLLRGLAHGAPGEHPSADLLTAFAEGTLLERERESVMAHVAGCAECRAVLSLCAVEEQEPAREDELVSGRRLELVAAPAIATPQREKQARQTRTWLPWLTVAAALAVVSVVALRYAEKKSPPIQVAPETQTAEVKQPPPVAAPAPMNSRVRQSDALKKTAPPSSTESVVVETDAVGATQQSASGIESSSMQAEEHKQVAAQQAAKAIANGALEPSQAQQERKVAQAEARSLELGQSQTASDKQMARGGAGGANQTMHGVQSQQQMAQGQEQPDQQAAAPRPATPAFSNAMTAGAMLREPAASGARPHWRINEQGHPERSLSDGVWEPVLTSDSTKMRVISVWNGQVWVGGEKARVYRSNDQGASWQPVTLPEKNGGPHVIVHIRFESAETGTIEALDGTTWISSDGGATWN